jgi:hypothetical protein
MKLTSSNASIGLFACAALAAAGCVFGNNSDRPVLSVDLLWDKSPGERFASGSCESADVVYMEWKLEDEKGHSVRKSEDEDDKECQAGFDFFDLEPGEYTLTVTGYDADDAPVWASECTGLSIERFDSLYACRIEQEP